MEIRNNNELYRMTRLDNSIIQAICEATDALNDVRSARRNLLDFDPCADANSDCEAIDQKLAEVEKELRAMISGWTRYSNEIEDAIQAFDEEAIRNDASA